MASNEIDETYMAFKEMPLYLYSEPDVTLVIGEKELEIKVHEYVVAPQSEFFKTALDCGLKETHERRIPLPEMQLGIIIQVLNWLYRAPLVSPFRDGHIFGAFSDDSTQKLEDTMQAFDYLRIKGAGRDYSKLVEEILHKIGSEFLVFNTEHAGNIFTVLNEVYKHGGSITREALDRLVIVMIRKRSKFPSSELTLAMEQVPDPDGRCFRDISSALGKRLAQLNI